MSTSILPRLASPTQPPRGIRSRLAAALSRLSATRRPTPPTAREDASTAARTLDRDVTFIVQWVGWDGTAAKVLEPFAVPNAVSALVFVDSMPSPILSATAYRVEQDEIFGETRTIIAYRRNPVWSEA